MMQDAAPSAWILIPVHNRKALTRACLERLHWCREARDWEVLVVDDGCTDGTTEMLAEQFPWVHTLKGDGSLFWTGAIRAAMKEAEQKGASEMVWLNDDTLPERSTLEHLVQEVRNGPRRFVAAQPCVDGAPTAFSSLRRIGVAAGPGEQREVDVLAGFLVAFPASVVREIGLPDPTRFPHYAGDSAYTRMAHNAGYQLLLDGDAPLDLNDFTPYPEAAEHFWQPEGASFVDRLRRTFLSTRSPFRLSTRWHLDFIYRGKLMAPAVFVGRTLKWAGEIFRHRPSHPASSPVPTPHA